MSFNDPLEYGGGRNQFWLRIHENDESVSLTVNAMTKNLINYFYPEIVQCNSRGWKPTRNQNGNYNLWIRDSDMDWYVYEQLKKWAEKNQKRIWLSTNKNTRLFFGGGELDYCVAYDWNYDVKTRGDAAIKNQIRTAVGEAEYQMKYQNPSKLKKEMFSNLLKRSIMECVECLPYEMDDFIVTAIPAVELGQHKPAWRLAEYVSHEMKIPMIPLTIRDKPSMKSESFENRVRIWQSILRNQCMFPVHEDVKKAVHGRNILIIDDLYQSGASVWCLAEFLKNDLNANIVVAATVVKSLRDGDNS